MKKQYEMPQTEVLLMEAIVMQAATGVIEGDATGAGKSRIFEEEWSDIHE